MYTVSISDKIRTIPKQAPVELEWKGRAHFQLLFRGLILPRAEESMRSGKIWSQMLAPMISDESTFHLALNMGDLFYKQT